MSAWSWDELAEGARYAWEGLRDWDQDKIRAISPELANALDEIVEATEAVAAGGASGERS